MARLEGLRRFYAGHHGEKRIGRALSALTLLLATTPGIQQTSFSKESKPEAPPSSQLPPSTEYLADEILIKFKEDIPQTKKTRIYENLELSKKRTLDKINVDVVTIPEDTTVAATLDRLDQNPLIEYAEPDYIARPDAVTNDPQLSQQPGYFQAKVASSTEQSAWNITSGDPQVKAAVLDTGIKEDHPDLQGKVLGRANFGVSPSNSDLCGIGGHGTGVAGIIGASTNNEIGVAGIGYNTSLLNVKISGIPNSDGTINECFSTDSRIAEATIWAADNNAKVINISFGGPDSQVVQDAVLYAWNRNTIIVASAGNNNTDIPQHPAAYEQVIAVAAVDSNDQKESASNYGSSWVDVASPTNDQTTSNQDGYGIFGGTSAASAHVAGVTALIWAAGNCSTNVCVRNVLEQNADQIPGTGTYWQHGRINAYDAVTSTPEPTPTPSPTPTPTPTPPPPPRTIYPLADSFVRSSARYRNFGRETSMRVNRTAPVELSYLKYDLRSLAGKNIKSAKLRLRIVNGTTSPQRIYRVRNSWTETGIKYHNRPGNLNFLKSFRSARARTWLELDMTTTFRSYRGQILSFSVVAAGGDNITFYSRQSSSYDPRIIVQLG